MVVECVVTAVEVAHARMLAAMLGECLKSL